ncbi:MAG: hypothetical protein IJA60_07800 [Clostridia bacterium]|nr:hypothetical protein [Clostridia bacterium]
MTTRKLSSEKLLDLSLLKNTTRRRLPHILVAFLVSFFTVSVPIMMVFDEHFLSVYDLYDRISVDMMIERVVNRVSEIMVVNLIATYALAVYFGIITLGYMMKRRSAHFYHALPQKRETLYVTSTVSALLCAAIGAVVNIAIAAGELAVFGVGYSEVYGAFFSLAFNNMLVFLSVYAITVFAGTVSGNRVVQVLMTLVIMLYPLATYLGMILVRQSHAMYFFPEYYLNENNIQWLSPFAHVIVNYSEKISLLTTALALVATVALLIGGLAIYKKRAIENSERPIVFKKLGSVLKYMFMFTVTIFAGMFFYNIEYNVFSLIFGCVSGAVLSFMLFNTILEKTPKAMFKNIKGLCIFAAAFAVYMAIFGFDVFKLDKYIPDSDDIAYAEIDLYSAEYDDNRFDDPEILKALVTVLENQQQFNDNFYVTPLEHHHGSFRINVVMHTKLGLPVARTYNVTKYIDGVDEFLELYANDERMQNAFDKRISALQAHTGNGYEADLHVQLDGYRNAECPLDDILSVYIGEVSKMNYETLSKPAIGYVSITYINTAGDNPSRVYRIYDEKTDARIFDDLPIYADMTDTIAYLGYVTKNSPHYKIAEADNTYNVIGANVYDTREPQTQYYAYVYPNRGFTCDISRYPSKSIDMETAKKINDLIYVYNHNQPGLTSLFVAIDKDFVIQMKYIYEEQVLKSYDYTKDVAASYETLLFPRGMVPAEIKSLFN